MGEPKVRKEPKALVVAVGMFPLGASAVGTLDMNGNIWKWRSSGWFENSGVYGKDAKEREDLGGRPG